MLPTAIKWGTSSNNFDKKSNQYIFETGSYIAGEDFPAGNYDIEILEEQTTFMQKKLKVNDAIINLPLTKNEVIDITGMVKLVPHSITKLSKSDSYNIIHSGYYEIGKDIPAGEYLLTITIKNNEKELPLIQILNNDDVIIDSFNFENKDKYNITLVENQILEIHKNLFYESDNIVINLKAHEGE